MSKDMVFMSFFILQWPSYYSMKTALNPIFAKFLL